LNLKRAGSRRGMFSDYFQELVGDRTGLCEMRIGRKPILHAYKMCLSNIRATGRVRRGQPVKRNFSRGQPHRSRNPAEKVLLDQYLKVPASSDNNAFDRVPTPIRPNSSHGKDKCQPSDMSRGGERVTESIQLRHGVYRIWVSDSTKGSRCTHWLLSTLYAAKDICGSASCSNDDCKNVSNVRDRKDMEHGRSKPEGDE
jgi:hypothetical protein